MVVTAPAPIQGGTLHWEDQLLVRAGHSHGRPLFPTVAETCEKVLSLPHDCHPLTGFLDVYLIHKNIQVVLVNGVPWDAPDMCALPDVEVRHASSFSLCGETLCICRCPQQVPPAGPCRPLLKSQSCCTMVWRHDQDKIPNLEGKPVLQAALAPSPDFPTAARSRDPHPTGHNLSPAAQSPFLFHPWASSQSVSPTRPDSHCDHSSGLLSGGVCDHQPEGVLSSLQSRQVKVRVRAP